MRSLAAAWLVSSSLVGGNRISYTNSNGLQPMQPPSVAANQQLAPGRSLYPPPGPGNSMLQQQSQAQMPYQQQQLMQQQYQPQSPPPMFQQPVLQQQPYQQQPPPLQQQQFQSPPVMQQQPQQPQQQQQQQYQAPRFVQQPQMQAQQQQPQMQLQQQISPAEAGNQMQSMSSLVPNAIASVAAINPVTSATSSAPPPLSPALANANAPPEGPPPGARPAIPVPAPYPIGGGPGQATNGVNGPSGFNPMANQNGFQSGMSGPQGNQQDFENAPQQSKSCLMVVPKGASYICDRMGPVSDPAMMKQMGNNQPSKEQMEQLVKSSKKGWLIWASEHLIMQNNPAMAAQMRGVPMEDDNQVPPVSAIPLPGTGCHTYAAAFSQELSPAIQACLKTTFAGEDSGDVAGNPPRPPNNGYGSQVEFPMPCAACNDPEEMKIQQVITNLENKPQVNAKPLTTFSLQDVMECQTCTPGSFDSSTDSGIPQGGGEGGDPYGPPPGVAPPPPGSIAPPETQSPELEAPTPVPPVETSPPPSAGATPASPPPAGATPVSPPPAPN